MPRVPKAFVNYSVRVRFSGAPSPGLRKRVGLRIAALLDQQGPDSLYALPGVEQHYIAEIDFATQPVRKNRHART